MNIFKNIVHLIEDTTDIPENEEEIISWAKDNTENEMIFNIYTFASFASTVNNFEFPDKKSKRRKVKKCIQIVFRNAKIPQSFLGAKYLEAILLDNYKCQSYYKVRKIYEDYAIKFKVEPIKVEKAIRYITDSYQRGLQSYFKTNSRITSKKLIFLLQNEIEKMLESYV